MKTCEKCQEPANNVAMTLCSKHTDEYRKQKAVEKAARRLANLKYITPDMFEVENGCPYCGDPKSQGTPCCGEVHDEPQYTIIGESHSMSEDDFYFAYEVVDSLPRECACEKTCFCEPESTDIDR